MPSDRAEMGVSEAPISDLHAMLAKIGREYHAARLNRIVNDPSVYPWVCGTAVGPLDLEPAIADQKNILLMGERGGVVFVLTQPGIYEAHTQVLPEGRGKWGVVMVRAALHWMFTRTDAIEIMTKCPEGNVGALWLAKRIGGKRLFTNRNGWIMDHKTVPAEIYGLTIQDWIAGAPGLVERGHWFHERLEAEYRRLGAVDPSPHPDDPEHDRYVGAAAEMMMGGQPHKAAVFYSRWANMAGYAPISIIKDTFPAMTVDIQDAIIIVRPDGDFWVSACRKPLQKELH